MPVQFRATEASGAEAWPSEDWWRGFRSPELTALIEQARAQNFDIAAAIARVRQADAQVRIAGAAMLPNVTATASRELAAGRRDARLHRGFARRQHDVRRSTSATTASAR